MESKIKEFLRLNALLIGSRAFNLHTEDSDYDYVMPFAVRHEFVSLLQDKKFNLVILDDYDSPGIERLPMKNKALIKFYMNNYAYEVLVYNHKEFDGFNQINQLMRYLLTYPENVSKLKNKHIRVPVYNNIMKAVFQLNN